MCQFKLKKNENKSEFYNFRNPIILMFQTLFLICGVFVQDLNARDTVKLRI